MSFICQVSSEYETTFYSQAAKCTHKPWLRNRMAWKHITLGALIPYLLINTMLDANGFIGLSINLMDQLIITKHDLWLKAFLNRLDSLLLRLPHQLLKFLQWEFSNNWHLAQLDVTKMGICQRKSIWILLQAMMFLLWPSLRGMTWFVDYTDQFMVQDRHLDNGLTSLLQPYFNKVFNRSKQIVLCSLQVLVPLLWLY